jgi:hypothetical protein
MVSAIRSATVGTFKWGVSLIGPVLVTRWAINKFEGLGALHDSFPSVRSGIVGLFSFVLLRRLTGCGLKTALVASSVIPILHEVSRRTGPSGGGGGVQQLFNLESSKKDARVRAQKMDESKELVNTVELDNFINYIIDSRSNPTVRFRELTEDVKEQVWSNIFSSMERYAQHNPSQKLPFVGYAGETLSLIKTNEDPLKLEAKTGDRVLWRINLDINAICSDSPRTQMYIELLIAKHTFFERHRNNFYSAFASLIRFCEHNTIQSFPQLSFSMFNNVLAQHDLTFSVQTECNARDGYFNKTATFAKQSSSDPSNSLTLTVEWTESDDRSTTKTQNYEVSIQRGLASERQTYTFTFQDYEWHVTYNQKAYDLLDICKQLDDESEWNLKFNQDNMRDLFEMIQMSLEFLYSSHTLLFHQNSTIPYLTDGTLIPYERLQQIATYTNEAKGQSVLRLEGNRVLWENRVVEEYSEPMQSFDSDDFMWNHLSHVSHEENESGSEGDNNLTRMSRHNQPSGVKFNWNLFSNSLRVKDSSGNEYESDVDFDALQPSESGSSYGSSGSDSE